MFLLKLWTLPLSTNESNCIDNYLDFEEKTFGNNSKNRVKLYQAFYPPNDHLPYSVVVTYQAALPNGTRLPSFRHMLWVRCQKENTWTIPSKGVPQM